MHLSVGTVYFSLVFFISLVNNFRQVQSYRPALPAFFYTDRQRTVISELLFGKLLQNATFAPYDTRAIEAYADPHFRVKEVSLTTKPVSKK